MSSQTDDLMLFLTVAEAGSFQKAADRLNMDRSVVSRRMAALEQSLHMRLLHRTTRALSVTPAGQSVIERARGIQRLLDEVRAISQNSRTDISGTLRITTAPHFGALYVQPAVNAFISGHPEVEVELRLEERMTPIVAEGFDLAIRIGEPKDSTLIGRKLAEHSMELVASRSFIDRHGIPTTIGELVKLPTVAYRSTGVEALPTQFLNTPADERIDTPRVVLWSNSVDALKSAVLSGVGWAVLSTFIVHRELASGDLVRLMPHALLRNYSPIYALTAHRDVPKRTKIFLDYLSKEIGNPPVWNS